MERGERRMGRDGEATCHDGGTATMGVNRQFRLNSGGGDERERRGRVRDVSSTGGEEVEKGDERRWNGEDTVRKRRSFEGKEGMAGVGREGYTSRGGRTEGAVPHDLRSAPTQQSHKSRH